MRTGFFITARLKSTRLPVKLLARIQGREVIRHVIDRAKTIAGIDRIVLCTSTNPQDMPLTDIALEEGISYYCGDPDDVLLRLKDAAIFFGIDHFVSVTADNPLFCTYHANRASDAIRQNPDIDYLYFSNLPIGAFVYALRTKLVEVVCKIKENNDTEIWGPYVNRPDIFNVKNIVAQPVFNMNVRLTLDEPEDLQFMEQVASSLAPRNFQDITLLEVADLVTRYPEMGRFNQGVKQSSIQQSVLDKIDRLYAAKSCYINQLLED